MTGWRIEAFADASLDDIYEYTAERWGEDQADRHIRDLFIRFEQIAQRAILWRSIPAAVGVVGFYARCRSHFVYWHEDGEGIAVAAVLHERMNHFAHLRTAFDSTNN